MDILTGTALQYGSRIRPCLGERVSGDAVVAKRLEHGLLLAIVDVLGHGTEAHALTPVIDAFLNRFGSADVCAVMNPSTGTSGAVAVPPRACAP